MSDPTLAKLVAARISHDLASPLGAIANGLELLAMDLPPSPELALLQDSMAEALARLAMLRLAFGGGSAPVTDRELVAAITTAGAGRFTVSADLPAELPRGLAQRLLLGAMCLTTALPRGNQLALTPAPEGHWTLQASGPDLRMDSALWAPLLAGQVPEVPPARAHFAQLAILCPSPPLLRSSQDTLWLTL